LAITLFAPTHAESKSSILELSPNIVCSFVNETFFEVRHFNVLKSAPVVVYGTSSRPVHLTSSSRLASDCWFENLLLNSEPSDAWVALTIELLIVGNWFGTNPHFTLYTYKRNTDLQLRMYDHALQICTDSMPNMYETINMLQQVRYTWM